MSRTLFALAVICLVAAVQAADPSYVEMTLTNTADCSGTPIFSYNYTANDCRFSEGTASVFSFDASNVYIASYENGDACNSTTLVGVVQIPIGCGTGTSFGQRFRTYGTAPQLPFGSFPPTNFATATVYYNVSAADATTGACSAGNGMNAIQAAGKVGDACQVRSSSPFQTSPSSTQSYCSGSTATTVTFSDSTCGSVATAVQQTAPSGCVNSGAKNAFVQQTCDAGSPPTLPTHGYMEYDNAGCTENSNTKTYEWIDGCFDRHTFACSATNGTDTYAIVTMYGAGKSDGSCDGSVIQTITQLPGQCVPGPSAGTWRKYSCDLSPQGGAASVLSVSVATIVAAILAVFASRAL